MASKEVRTALSAPFPPEQVYQRQGPGGKKLDYIAGETVIRRLAEATKDQVFNSNEQGYAWNAQIHTLERIVTGEPGEESTTFLAVVQGQLLIGGDMGTGMGAMRNPDPDMAIKSANTEALKNAAKNGFGVGLELWDAEYRTQLDQRRRAAGGNEQALKALVWDIAKKRWPDDSASAAQIAANFKVPVGDLSDPKVLATILEKEGVL